MRLWCSAAREYSTSLLHFQILPVTYIKISMSTIFQNVIPDQSCGSGLIPVQPSSVLLIIIFCTLLTQIRHWLVKSPKANFPLFNPAKGFGFVDMAARKEFSTNAIQLLREGEAANPKRPFNIMTNAGEMTILPPDMADKLRSEPSLDFLGPVVEDAHGHLPGFEAFGALREQKLVLAVVNKHLTKYLSKALLMKSPNYNANVSQTKSQSHSPLNQATRYSLASALRLVRWSKKDRRHVVIHRC